MKKTIATVLAFICLIILSACSNNDSSNNSNAEETTEHTYDITSEYKFRDIKLAVSDEWECTEENNTCTITCLEDYSFAIVSVYDASKYSGEFEIYNSFSSVQGVKDISKLSKYKDIPMYTFSYTSESNNDSYENIFFLKNDILYFIGVVKTTDDKDSIIYNNLNSIILPIRENLLATEAFYKSIS